MKDTKTMSKASVNALILGLAEAHWARNTNPYPDYEGQSVVSSMMKIQGNQPSTRDWFVP